jgi:hypothetical protein
MTGLLSKPALRLAGRALVAGAAQAILALQHSHSGDATIAWKSAATAGALAFCEVFTPLNPLVGVFKKTRPAKTRKAAKS